ncbi:MAG: 4Fe-4S dicluster domain-containing protein [Chloroflexi bacterium]|nr:4Fe-4S dicluster domain-containing protein [Chloroflexota bacterium]
MATESRRTTPANEGQSEGSRRDFLRKFAGTVIAGLVAPVVVGEVASAAPSPQAKPAEGLAEIPAVPGPVAGEDPVVRMMQDLQRALKKPAEQRRWTMVIDLRKCIGCQGCTIACITENKLPPGIAYRPVITETTGSFPNVSRSFVPRPCMQCDNPPCVSVCPVNATYRRPDGIVAINYDQCIGCRYCITACPYSARSFDSGFFYSDLVGGGQQPYETLPSPEYKEARIRTKDASPIGNARKCQFCIHRVEAGELPACVLSCFGRATYFGDRNDDGSLVAQLVSQSNATRLKEELGAKPNVYYLV